MRFIGSIAAAGLLIASCGTSPSDSNADAGNEAPSGNGAAAPAPGKANPAAPAAAWVLQSGSEGVTLALRSGSDPAALRLVCPAGRNSLLVNVPAFKPVGSEERLSFGSGGEASALVADPRGDAGRGGVSGEAAVPANLIGLIAGPISVSYGAQRSGPHPAPDMKTARDFVAACRKGPSPAPPLPPASPSAGGPCQVQDGKPVQVAARAVGTEPFWGARIEGRCVTYSHPEDQKGTRIWTRYSPSAGGGTWVGTLGGSRFELRTRAAPGCSDGMSDRKYPMAAELVVKGERRSGCAEPL